MQIISLLQKTFKSHKYYDIYDPVSGLPFTNQWKCAELSSLIFFSSLMLNW